MENALDKELIENLVSLSPPQKRSILELIRSFAGERISIAQYNREIQEAEERVAAGDFITQEELEKEAQSW